MDLYNCMFACTYCKMACYSPAYGECKVCMALGTAGRGCTGFAHMQPWHFSRSADLGKGRNNEEPFEDKFSFSVSVTTQHHCFSWLEICMRKHFLDDRNGITHLIRLQAKQIHAKIRTQNWREFLQCLALKQQNSIKGKENLSISLTILGKIYLKYLTSHSLRLN